MVPKRAVTRILEIGLILLAIACGKGSDTPTDQESQVGNGGEGLAMSFVARGYYVLGTLRTVPESFNVMTGGEINSFESALSTTKVTAVERPLVDSHGNELAALTGENPEEPGKKWIRINMKHWNKMVKDNPNETFRLVFHEYLWASNIDDSNYKISNKLKVDGSGFEKFQRESQCPKCEVLTFSDYIHSDLFWSLDNEDLSKLPKMAKESFDKRCADWRKKITDLYGRRMIYSSCGTPAPINVTSHNHYMQLESQAVISVLSGAKKYGGEQKIMVFSDEMGVELTAKSFFPAAQSLLGSYENECSIWRENALSQLGNRVIFASCGNLEYRTSQNRISVVSTGILSYW